MCVWRRNATDLIRLPFIPGYTLVLIARMPTKGWPGWVDLGGWLHLKTVTHPSSNRTRRRGSSSIETSVLPVRLRQAAIDKALLWVMETQQQIARTSLEQRSFCWYWLQIKFYSQKAACVNKLCGRPPQYAPHPVSWPFDLESDIRVSCDVGYLCANFGLSRSLCSRLRPDVRDRQTSDRRQTRIIAYNPLP